MPHFYALYSNIIYLWDTDDFPRKRALHFTIFSLKPMYMHIRPNGGGAVFDERAALDLAVKNYFEGNLI